MLDGKQAGRSKSACANGRSGMRRASKPGLARRVLKMDVSFAARRSGVGGQTGQKSVQE
jgi:hypothetical protein